MAETAERMVSRMITAPLRYTDDVLALMARNEELVPAAAIAPIIRMKPARMIEYARNGQWPREICNYVISGRCVKFFRIDGSRNLFLSLQFLARLVVILYEVLGMPL